MLMANPIDLEHERLLRSTRRAENRVAQIDAETVAFCCTRWGLSNGPDALAACLDSAVWRGEWLKGLVPEATAAAVFFAYYRFFRSRSFPQLDLATLAEIGETLAQAAQRAADQDFKFGDIYLWAARRLRLTDHADWHDLDGDFKAMANWQIGGDALHLAETMVAAIQRTAALKGRQ